MTIRTVVSRALALTGVIFLGSAGPLRAQIPGIELSQVQATREALQDLLGQLEAAANSNVYSGDIRAQARAQATLVRRRLTEGDFQVGDRVYLQIVGESLASDTFTVRGGREIVIPNMGTIPLAGVLRTELGTYLEQQLARFIRQPTIRTQALIRVAVIGEVQRQGFYTVPVDIPVNEVLTVAGGLSGTAELDGLRIERGAESIYQGPELQRAITEGRTLDAMSIQAGDRFIIPQKKQRNPYQFVQTLNILLTIPFTIAGLIALINR